MDKGASTCVFAVYGRDLTEASLAMNGGIGQLRINKNNPPISTNGETVTRDMTKLLTKESITLKILITLRGWGF